MGIITALCYLSLSDGSKFNCPGNRKVGSKYFISHEIVLSRVNPLLLKLVPLSLSWTDQEYLIY